MTTVATRAGRAATGPLAGKAVFWLPIVPLVALDLWSKSAVFAWLAERSQGAFHPEAAIWRGPISMSLVRWTNPGTVWGLGQSLNTPLIVLRCVALVVLVWFAWRTPPRARLQLLALGLILAGAIGNLYDNFTQPGGAVRDFLLFFVGQGADRKVFPAFNVADSCITVGAIGLLAAMFWREAPAAPPPGRVS